MSGHTKGPWMVDNYRSISGGAVVAPVTGNAGTWIAHVFGGNEESANAALIAAAPDLLAACEAVASLAGKCLLGDGNYREASAEAFNQAADLVREAIAKAVPQ